MKRLSGDFDDVAQRWSVLRVREQVTTGFGGGNAEIREEVVLEVWIDYNIELFTTALVGGIIKAKNPRRIPLALTYVAKFASALSPSFVC